MPTQTYQLTWMESSRRWRKIRRGRTYYFPLRPDETMKSSYRRCLGEWEAEWKKLVAATPKETPEERRYRSAIRKWRQVRDWHARGRDGGSPESQAAYDRADRMVAELQGRLKKGGDLPPLDRHESDPLYGVSEAGRWVWMDRQRQMDASATPRTGTIAGIATDFLKAKREQVSADERSAGRYDAMRCHLEQFRDWAGGHRPIADVRYELLEAYHGHLLKLSQTTISKYTARDRMQTVKQFATYAARRQLILPIFTNAHDFAFRLAPPKIQTADVSTIKRLLEASSSKTKLYILLMLNTGMTQKDVSDLRQDEVDWELGRLRRKRSKTRHRAGVPEVDYPLWTETFRLLKEHRSADPTRVLINDRGGELFERVLNTNGRTKLRDNINSAFRRVSRKLGLMTVTLKQFRATSATVLNKHKDYARFAQHFLGQSPRTIAERHYVVQSQELFDEAIVWLGKQYGL